MKPLKADSPSSGRHSRAGGNPVKIAKPRSVQNTCSVLLRRQLFTNRLPACAGMTQIRRLIKLSQLVAALLLSCISIPAAHAETQKSEKLGRLFFTPAQRQQLDYTYARSASAEGNSSAVLTVNGIVQKQGGPRTVWINGVSQNVSNNSERNPTAQNVSVPGKAHPVKLKVGDRILLDQPAQEASAE